MGSKTSSQQNQQQATFADPQAYADYNKAIGRAQRVSNTPYTAYNGELTAPVNAQEQTATTALNGLGAVANNYFGSAAQQSGQGAQAVNPSNVGLGAIAKYMSPYQSSVINSTQALLNQQDQIQQQQLTGSAIGAGAFGGDRAGVAAAALAGQQDLANNSTLANLQNQNYAQALNEANTQQAVGLGAAQANRAAVQQNAATLAGIGSAATSAGLGVAGAQLGAGELQQQTQQASDTANYGQFLQKQAYPFQTEQYLSNIIEGIAPNYGSESAGTSTTQTSPLNSIIGGTVALGGLLSDRRAKEGIRKVGALFDGQPIYAFRYKGSPTTEVGLVAQDVEKKHPGAVAPGLGGFKHVNYALATQAAADKGHFARGGRTLGDLGYHTLTREEVAHLDDVPARASGGSVGLIGATPYADASGYVPATGVSGAMARMTSSPTQSQPTSTSSQPTGVIPSFTQFNPIATAAQNIGNATGLSGALSSVGNYLGGGMNSVGMFNFASGGKVEGLGGLSALRRRGYDGGGVVTPDAMVFDPNALGAAPAIQPGVGAVSPPVTMIPPSGGVTGQSQGLAPVSAAAPPPYVPADRTGLGAAAPSSDNAPVPPGLGAINAVSQPSADPMGGYMARVRAIESSGNDNASSGTAFGRYQFTPGTWADVANRHPDLGLTSDGIGDAGQQEAAMRALTSDNSAELTRALGRTPTLQELYMAHQQGAVGAIGLLTNPNARASDIVGQSAITSNGGAPDMTAGQFTNMWASRFNGTAGVTGGLPPSALGYTSGTGGVSGPQAASQGLGGVQAQRQPQPTGLAAAVPPSKFSDYFGGMIGGTGQPSPGHSGGILGLFPGLTDDERLAIISAGAGMAASPSKSPGLAFGQGLQAGVGTLQGQQKLAVERARAQGELANYASEADYRKGSLGIEGDRVTLAMKELMNNIENARKKIGIDQQNADSNTARTKSETSLQRAETVEKLQTFTPQGLLTRDPDNPGAPPKLIPYSTLQGGSGGGGNSGGSGAASGQGSATSGPVVDPSGYVHPPAQIPINPMLFSPEGRAASAETSKGTMDGARTAYEASQGTKMTLDQMQHEFANLPKTGFLSSGPGQQERAHAVNSINSVLKTFGVGPENQIDPAAVASTEDLKKLTVRMGQDLARSLGGREPGFIVQQSVGAVPSSENSAMGFQRITAGLRAAAQRNEDRYNFLTKWQQKSGGDLTGADDAFNKANPPSRYVGQAITSTLPPAAVTYLRQHPEARGQFDAKYGNGTSNYVIGQ